MPWAWCLHQKPWELYPDPFNSTPMERQSLTDNPHPISSVSQTMRWGKWDLTMWREQPGLLSITTSRVQKHDCLTGSPG